MTSRLVRLLIITAAAGLLAFILVRTYIKEITRYYPWPDVWVDDGHCQMRRGSTGSVFNESTDVLSAITIKVVAEVFFRGSPVPGYATARLPPPLNSALRCIHPATILFVDSSAVDRFAFYFLDALPAPIVLVSGDTDLPMPGSLIAGTYERLLASEKIIHWYAMNCDIHDPPAKFSCFHGGISQWGPAQSAMVEALNRKYHLLPKTTDYDVYVSFDVSSHDSRKAAHDYMCNGPMKAYSHCFYGATPAGLLGHYETIARSKFVLSPRGVGEHTYRTYEALLLGAYPILHTSTLDPLYSDLPVLIVDRWEDITKDLLDATFLAFSQKTYDMSAITVRRWFEELMQYREEQVRFVYSNDQ